MLFSCVFKDWFLKDYRFITILLYLFVFVISGYYNSGVFMHNAEYGIIPFMFLSGISGTLIVISISKYINNKALKFLGTNTLSLMGFHQNVEYMIAYFYGIKKTLLFLSVSFILMLGLSVLFTLAFNIINRLNIKLNN